MSEEPMVEQLERLEQEATPGPWATEFDGIYHADRLYMVTPTGDSDQDRANAELIVAMRNALPALLSHLREQEQWHCTVEGRTTPCGTCDGCRWHISSLRAALREQRERAERAEHGVRWFAERSSYPDEAARFLAPDTEGASDG